MLKKKTNNPMMTRLRSLMPLLLLFLAVSCGSDDGMDQNTNDPGNTPGQTDNPVSDADEDGIPDDDDQCPDTPTDEQADENGCSPSQLDSDNDGVNDATDECPDTPEGEDVDEQGCSDTQKDSDGDGVNDAEDQCPDTPADSEVNEEGCVEEARTYIPDDAFEQYLIDQGYDDLLDDYVITEQITGISEMEVSGNILGGPTDYPIQDWTGIEDFKNLETLKLAFLSIKSLEKLETIPALRSLILEYINDVPMVIRDFPQLELFKFQTDTDWTHWSPEITITNNPNLNEIVVNYLEIGTYLGEKGNIQIDNNPNLGRIEMIGVSCDIFEVMNNPSLSELKLGDYFEGHPYGGTSSSALFLTNNTALETLNLENFGTSGNVSISNCPNIKIVKTIRDLIPEHLDFSQLTNLEELYLRAVTTLDISSVQSLTKLEIIQDILGNRDYSISKLDVSNNNDLIDLKIDGHELNCIKVNQSQLDNIPSTWEVDPPVPYTLDCN